MIFLCYEKEQLKNFLGSLSHIITIIKTYTGQVFAPMIVQRSPINPDYDMIIVMRNIEKTDKIKFDSEAIIDDKKLARSF